MKNILTATQISSSTRDYVASRGQRWIKSENGKTWQLWQEKPLALIKTIQSRFIFWYVP